MTVGEEEGTQVPSKPGVKIGKDGKLYLPKAHPLFEKPEEGWPKGSWKGWLNDRWVNMNFMLRGFYATAVEWGVSFMDMATEYPKVAIVTVVLVGVVAEEQMAAHPMLAGTFQWIMFTIDPDAAQMIFPEDADPKDAAEAMDKVAADIVMSASEDYYNSAEYKALQLELRARMHAQILATVQEMTGIEELVVPLEPETEPE